MNKNEFNARVYNFPTSAILKNGRRINYYSFITSHEYKECDKAVERIKKLKAVIYVVNHKSV